MAPETPIAVIGGPACFLFGIALLLNVRGIVDRYADANQLAGTFWLRFFGGPVAIVAGCGLMIAAVRALIS